MVTYYHIKFLDFISMLSILQKVLVIWITFLFYVWCHICLAHTSRYTKAVVHFIYKKLKNLSQIIYFLMSIYIYFAELWNILMECDNI